MNNKKEIIVMGVIAVIVTVAAIVAIVIKGDFITENKKKHYQNSIEEEADNIKKSEMKDFTIIDINKYLELYKGKDSSIIMIGRTGCEYCQIEEPILRYVAYKYNLKIYYLSLDTFDDDSRSKLLNSDKYFKDNGGVNTPMVLIVKNNKMVAYIDELVNSSEYIKLFKDNGLINKK